MKSVSRLAVAAALAVSGASLAQAAAPMETLAPAAKAFLEKRAARLGAKALPKPEQPGGGTSPNWVKVDVDEPVLSTIKLLTPEVDASKPGAQVRFSIAATDDFSGISSIRLELYRSANYGWVSVEHYVGYPTKEFNGKIGMNLEGVASAGIWSVNSLTIIDAAGNYRNVSSTELQALGMPAQITIIGSASDSQSPTVVGGKVLTPVVNLSVPQKGTLNGTALAGFSVQVQDTGDAKVSGVRSAQATFCEPGNTYNCFTTSASTTAGAQSKLTLRTVPQYYSYYYAGTFKLTTLTVSDFAANTRTYTSAADGGDTDFNVMFPEGTTITVTE